MGDDVWIVQATYGPSLDDAEQCYTVLVCWCPTKPTEEYVAMLCQSDAEINHSIPYNRLLAHSVVRVPKVSAGRI